MWVWGIGGLAWALIWGFATQKVIENKGYAENWFWWGFFFGFIAFIVACTKAECVKTDSSDDRSFYNNGAGTYDERLLKAGGWKCSCGKVQASYVTSCSCGKSKHEVLRVQYEQAQEAARKQTETAEEQRKAAAIKEYKTLADDGVITREEFEAKKKQLLGI